MARPSLPKNPAPTAPSATRAPGARKAGSGGVTTPAWWTVAQLAERWQIPKSTIHTRIRQGIIRAWNVGTPHRHIYRISAGEVRRHEGVTA